MRFLKGQEDEYDAASEEAKLRSFDLGDMAFFSKQFDRALEEYRNALLIFEVNPQADAAFDVKQLKRAIADCERARAAALRRAEARRIREVAALLREEDARDRRRAAAKINTLWLEANRLYDRGEYAACERLCRRIMELDPAGGPARRR